jgi:hypothetical protein
VAAAAEGRGVGGAKHTNSGYSSHILNTGHKYGTIADKIDIVRTGKK